MTGENSKRCASCNENLVMPKKKKRIDGEYLYLIWQLSPWKNLNICLLNLMDLSAQTEHVTVENPNSMSQNIQTRSFSSKMVNSYL